VKDDHSSHALQRNLASAKRKSQAASKRLCKKLTNGWPAWIRSRQAAAWRRSHWDLHPS
jgi:hypothetical protein